MIERKAAEFVRKIAGAYPVVTIMGPRQSDKTTLAGMVFADYVYRNLEAEDVLQLAKNDPRAFLLNGEERMIIDEFVAMVPNARSPLVVYAGETFPGQAINYQKYFGGPPPPNSAPIENCSFFFGGKFDIIQS